MALEGTIRESEADLQAHAGSVYAFICSRVGHDEALAEDLTQETFLAALRGGFDGSKGALPAWLIGIAIHKVADHQRRSLLSRTRLAAEARLLAQRMAREPLPAEALARQETRVFVNAALAGMPAEAASLLVRKYFDGAPVAQMALEMGLSTKAVESQLTRARRQLVDALGQFGGLQEEHGV